MNKKALICGNGPSFVDVEWERIPSDVDIFRCNQFYFEDTYYVGSVVDHVFLNIEIAHFQVPTLLQLQNKKEYEIKNWYFNMAPEALFFNMPDKTFKKYPFITPSIRLLDSIKDFSMYFAYLNAKYEKRITSVFNMLITAIVLGYREIYLTGVDFYETGNKHAYKSSHNLSKIVNITPNYVNPLHCKWIDLECLKWACNYLNAEFIGDFQSPIEEYIFPKSSEIGQIFATSQVGPLSCHLPLASIKENNISTNKKIFEKKNANSTRDIIYRDIPSINNDKYLIFLENRINLLKKEIDNSIFNEGFSGVFSNFKTFIKNKKELNICEYRRKKYLQLGLK